MFVPKQKDGCSTYLDTRAAWNSSSFVTADGNCTQFEKLNNAYHGHARQIVIIADQNAVAVSW